MSTITLTGISLSFDFNPVDGSSTNTGLGTGTMVTTVSDDHTFVISPENFDLTNATGTSFGLALTGLNGLIADSADPLTIDPDVLNDTGIYIAQWDDGGVMKSTILLSLNTLNTITFQGTNQLFVLGGDALPAFADLAAFEAWNAGVTQDFLGLLASPFAPGTPFDLRDLPGVTISEDDVISGPFLPFYIDAGEGNDLVEADFGTQTIIGGNGDDTLDGGLFDDFLMGNADNDRMIGGGGSDIMFGGTGNDTMNGNVGDDEIFGGSGADRMRGGAGRDTMSGNSGDDTMDGGRDNDVMDGGGGNDLLSGEHGHDIMFGLSGNDTMDGGEGRDTLNGGSGNDMLTGGTGRDRLVGNSGDDTLDGGRDDDVLRGGAGADVFVFNHNSGQDRIADFTDDVDRLQITSGFYSDVNDLLSEAIEVNGDVILFLTPPPAPDAFGAGPEFTIDQILVENTTIAQLTNDIDLIPLFV